MAYFNKIDFQSAYRHFVEVIKPVATYGVSVFTSLENQVSVDDHYRCVIGQYWKRWANISKYHSNQQLVKHLYEDDFVKLRDAKPCNRRPFALFYCNGLHHLMCRTEQCYNPGGNIVFAEYLFAEYLLAETLSSFAEFFSAKELTHGFAEFVSSFAE